MASLISLIFSFFIVSVVNCRPQFIGYQEAPRYYTSPVGYGGYGGYGGFEDPGQQMIVAAPDDPIFVVYEYENSSGASTGEDSSTGADSSSTAGGSSTTAASSTAGGSSTTGASTTDGDSSTTDGTTEGSTTEAETTEASR